MNQTETLIGQDTTLEESGLNNDVKKGEIYFVTHRPTVTIRIIDVVEDTPSDNTFVVFLYELSPDEAVSLNKLKFDEFINSGFLMKQPEYKYKVGQAFYGMNGALYIIQHPSNINHRDNRPRYFMTIARTMTEDECDPEFWGNIQAPVFELTEAILDESILDSLEPFDTFNVIEDLSFRKLIKEFKLMKSTTDEENEKKKGYAL